MKLFRNSKKVLGAALGAVVQLVLPQLLGSFLPVAGTPPQAAAPGGLPHVSVDE